MFWNLLKLWKARTHSCVTVTIFLSYLSLNKKTVGVHMENSLSLQMFLQLCFWLLNTFFPSFKSWSKYLFNSTFSTFQIHFQFIEKAFTSSFSSFGPTICLWLFWNSQNFGCCWKTFRRPFIRGKTNCGPWIWSPEKLALPSQGVRFSGQLGIGNFYSSSHRNEYRSAVYVQGEEAADEIWRLATLNERTGLLV